MPDPQQKTPELNRFRSACLPLESARSSTQEDGGGSRESLLGRSDGALTGSLLNR